MAFLRESNDEDRPRIIFTPNPEMVMLARRDASFAKILNSADLVVPDGIGIVYASRLTQAKIAKRVAGIDLLTSIFESADNCNVYFLGAAPGVAEAAAIAMQSQYAGLTAAGSHHGYFNENDDMGIIDKINQSNADIVLVGLGFPRQEKWIYDNHNKIKAKLIMGVGGSFDVLSGRLKRAPKLFQKLGLEWLYRLMRQPGRIWRQRVLVIFMLLVVYKKLRGDL